MNDHKTVNEQINTLKNELGAEDLVLVGDRGMRIRLNLEELSESERHGVSYISALASSEIRALINDGVIQLELFSKDLVEIEDNGTRYVLCNNPVLQKEKNQTRDALKSRFEQEISLVKNSWDKRREQNMENIKKIEDGHKNKKLVTRFTEKKLDNWVLRI